MMRNWMVPASKGKDCDGHRTRSFSYESEKNQSETVLAFSVKIQEPDSALQPSKRSLARKALRALRAVVEQSQAKGSDNSKTTPPKKFVDSFATSSNSKPSAEPCFVKVNKNNVTRDIFARPSLHIGQAMHSFSSPSSEFIYGESSASSSFCTSTTPISGNSCDRTEDSSNTRPSYMNLTH